MSGCGAKQEVTGRDKSSLVHRRSLQPDLAHHRDLTHRFQRRPGCNHDFDNATQQDLSSQRKAALSMATDDHLGFRLVLSWRIFPTNGILPAQGID